jgi:hypothetical protein
MSAAAADFVIGFDDGNTTPFFCGLHGCSLTARSRSDYHHIVSLLSYHRIKSFFEGYGSTTAEK